MYKCWLFIKVKRILLYRIYPLFFSYLIIHYFDYRLFFFGVYKYEQFDLHGVKSVENCVIHI